MEVKIYYEDTDCGGVVYYANYLKYFERARSEYLEKRGVSLLELHKQEIFFMVATANLKYRAPAHYGETLAIDTQISEVAHASFTFQYKVHEKTNRLLLVEGETKIVTVDGKGKLKRLNPDLKAKLK
ncbi:MAG: thioesterase family protein [Planctomycetota bacterium]